MSSTPSLTTTCCKCSHEFKIRPSLAMRDGLNTGMASCPKCSLALHIEKREGNTTWSEPWSEYVDREQRGPSPISQFTPIEQESFQMTDDKKIEVTGIQIEIPNGEPITLNLDEAKKLYDQLHKLLGEKIQYVPSNPIIIDKTDWPHWRSQPQQQPQPQHPASVPSPSTPEPYRVWCQGNPEGPS